MSDLFETETTETLSREAAAAKLRALADTLSRQNQVELVQSGKQVTIQVPDQVRLSVELEIGEENELEIELSW